jgi:glycosyltransferase involved in cell wall biosynthesis
VLLSIVIPSNNKTVYLLEAVTSLINGLAQEMQKRVEICISDNSSNDETKIAVSQIMHRFKYIKYRRSLDAPSLDENAYMVSTMASGQYIWFFGDDDVVVQDSLLRFVEFLENTTHKIVIVNSQSFYIDSIIQSRRMPLFENIIFDEGDSDNFMISMGGYLTYLPCIVIEREMWLENYNIQKQGTFFAHIHCTLKAKLKSSACFYASPIIQMRLHSQTWTEKHFQIWNIFYPQIIWEMEGFSDHAKIEVIQKNPLNEIKRYLSSRAYDRFDFKIWSKFIQKSSKVSNAKKLLSLIIAMIPVVILRNILIMQINRFRSKQTMQFCPELALAQLKKLS